MRAPIPAESGDPRFETRLFRPSEFERIYDLVDTAFGGKRPRELYDWLYRRNPLGHARCPTVVEKRSGRIVNAIAFVPWPIARDGEALCGALVGDGAVDPEFQHQGISAMRQKIVDKHPLPTGEVRFAWPNEKTVGSLRKHGRDSMLVGPMIEGVFPLEAPPRRLRRGWPRLLADVGDRLRRARERGGEGDRARPRRGLRVEEVSRFDSGFDEVTQRCMAWKGFWCPHEAEFLNWRYLDHPTNSYRALAVLDGDEVAGYCVVRTDRGTGLLMEFAAPQLGEVPHLLLRSARLAAVEADCRRLAFHAPPGWRHWPWLRAAGLVEGRPSRFIMVNGSVSLGSRKLENWQIVPGDSDAS